LLRKHRLTSRSKYRSVSATRSTQHGCAVFDADRVAKSCLNDPDTLALLNEIGSYVIEGNKVNIAFLAKILFFNRKIRARLERNIHPKVRAMMDAFIAEHREFRHVILDVSLLLEKGLQDYCDLIIFVYAPYNIRKHRAFGRGWDLEGFLARGLCQFTVEQKERMSDLVLPAYEGSGADLESSVKQIVEDCNEDLCDYIRIGD